MRLRLCAAFAIAAGFGGAGCEQVTCSQKRVRSIQYMNAGVDYYRQGLMPAAVRELKSAVAEDDTNVQARYNLGKVYQEMKNWEEASSELQKVVAAEPKVAIYHYDLGWAYDELKRFQQAEEEYRKAIEIDPKIFRAHYRLATVLEGAEKPQEADAEYRKAIDINPRFSKTFVRLGYLYLNNDFAKEAAGVFKGGLSVDENQSDPEMYNGLGAALAGTNQFADAVPQFEQALKLDKDMIDALYNLGMAEFSLGRKEDANKHLTEFTQRGQGRADPAYVRAASDKLAELMGLGPSDLVQQAGVPTKLGKAPPQ